MKHYNWGILGTSSVAEQFVEGLQHLPQAAVTAVCARNEAKTNRFAKKYSISSSFTSLDELLQSGLIDVLYIASPNHLHKEHCLQALNHGVPVLCEKPLATCPEDVEEIRRVAHQNKLLCMEAMWMRFIPLVEELAEKLHSGDIGQPVIMSANFGIPFSKNVSNKFEDKMGGGALLDLGIYPITLAHTLFGEVVDLQSQIIMNDHGVDETAAIIMKHKNGAISNLYTSIIAETDCFVSIIGTKGRIQVSPPIYRPYHAKTRYFDTTQATDISPSSFKNQIKQMIRGSRQFNTLALRVASVLSCINCFKGNKISGFHGNGYNYEAQEIMECLDRGVIESEQMSLSFSSRISSLIQQARKQSRV